MKMNLTTSEKNRGFVRFLLMSLLLSILILPAHAQDRVTVSGQVTDSSQTPLIGASVIEKGTTNGVTTDADGRYQISVKPDGVIDFSFIGYKPQSLAVMNRTEINVTMEEDATMIGEVVAIGYGSQRKEDLSMAVSTVKVDDAARSRAADLGTLLQGRMPGVTIQQSGDPLQKASFTVRGRGSKGNDDGMDKSAAYSRDNIGPTSGDGVLVVVDGVPGAPYMAEDIETITILKDAASAAIYGASVGSSGVILITTRQAQAGKARVNVNVSVGFERSMNLPTMLNAQQFCDVWGKAVENSPGRLAAQSGQPAGLCRRQRHPHRLARRNLPHGSDAALCRVDYRRQRDALVDPLGNLRQKGRHPAQHMEPSAGCKTPYGIQAGQMAEIVGARKLRILQRTGQHQHLAHGPHLRRHVVPRFRIGL